MTTPYTGPSMPLRFAFDPGAPVPSSAIASPKREIIPLTHIQDDTFTLQNPEDYALLRQGLLTGLSITEPQP